MRAAVAVLCALVCASATAEELPPAELPPDADVAPVELDDEGYETVIQADRAPAVSASEHHIGPRVLETTPRRTTEDLLRRAPGLLVVQHGNEGKGHQLFLRGFDAAHGADVEVTVDGLPVNEWSNVHGNGYIDLAFVPPEAVLSIDVTEAPLRVGQGPFATAGTLALHLGVPESQRGVRVAYEAGSTNRHRVSVVAAPRDADEGTFFVAEGLWDAGFGANRTTARGAALGRVRVLDDPDAGALDVLASVMSARFGLPGAVRVDDVEAGRIDLLGAYLDDTGGASARAVLALVHRWAGARDLVDTRAWVQLRELDLLESYTGLLDDPVHGDRRHQQESAVTGGARLRWTRRLHPTLDLTVGADWLTTRLAQRERHVDADHRPLSTTRDLGLVQTAAALLLGARWEPLEWLALDGGLRADLFHFDATDHAEGRAGDDTVAAVSPRVTATFLPHVDWAVHAGWGRGLRPPEGRAVTHVDAGSADRELDRYRGGEPQVTVSDTVEVGVTWRWDLYLEMSLAAFATFIERESIFDHVSGVNLEVNPTRRLGGDLSIHAMPAPWLDLRGTLTVVDARFTGSGAPIPGAPTLLGTVEAMVRHSFGASGDLRAGLHVMALGERPLAHGATAAPLAIGDLLVGYRWEWLDASVSVDNLFASDWREGEYHFASHWDRDAPRSALPVLHAVAGPPIGVRGSVGVRF